MEKQAFSSAECERVGLAPEESHYRIPGTGWVIYDATDSRLGIGSVASPYVWGYEHDEDGKEYGEVETLARALSCIRWANDNGMGDATHSARDAIYSALYKAKAL